MAMENILLHGRDAKVIVHIVKKVKENQALSDKRIMVMKNGNEKSSI